MTRVLVGHTIVPTIMPLYDGKVIAVQVYPKREDAGSEVRGLLIRGGKLLRAHAGWEDRRAGVRRASWDLALPTQPKHRRPD